ncbi:hypothetical protein GCM10011600_30150 [Pseudolysinimonas yzui]|uniref:DUF1990 domain-containing protein n=1 Tax=Pseudolysinimonas yzui TaxID=2708254 RepID=A0A8J3M3U8_9MICO|nr:hypothetical protein GCM10011600_30150 [Pseudolysinimonas yzui]
MTDHLPIWQRPVTYAAIGATQDDDFLRYPPKGYRAIERKVRIGHGEERWHHAWTETLSLGIQRRSGLRVKRVESPAEVLENSYSPVTFDQEGQPVQPASTTSGEQVYADTGAKLVAAGETAILLLGWGPLSLRAPVRIVYVIDEPTRRGFAYGTLPGHPESGEEAFIVEQREDESVWLTIRAFSRPAHPALWIVYPVLWLVQAIITSRYEHALTRPLS